MEVKDPQDFMKAKTNCKDCFGRGWYGVDFDTKKKLICKCAIKIRRKEGIKKALGI